MLDTLQGKLADMAKEIQDKKFEEQRKKVMGPTETLLQGIWGTLQSIDANTKTASQVTMNITKNLPGDVTTEAKATGGKILGPGGPTGDKIPAWLSDGEYVIKSSSVKSLGVHALDFMNKTGRVPGFKTGGYAGSTMNLIQTDTGEFIAGPGTLYVPQDWQPDTTKSYGDVLAYKDKNGRIFATNIAGAKANIKEISQRSSGALTTGESRTYPAGKS